jgi:protein-S-isoprenylcysteine O-methyltransferase Ste14
MTYLGPSITFLAFTAYAIVHSLLASLRAKQKVRASLGDRAERSYRFFYNIFSGVTLIPVLAVPMLLPGENIYRFTGPWLVASTLLQLLGALIILVGMLQTDIWHFIGLRQLVDTRQSDQSSMITHGLYRYIRHPLYTGGLLFIWFIPLMTTSLLAFNLAGTIYLYVGSIFEERRLIAEFGDDYRKYQQQVPRFIPWPRRNPTS